MSKKIKISNFEQDDKNFNKHTDGGMDLLKKSVETVGVIESITVSKDGKIITGNARHEVFNKILDENIEPIVVSTDGTRPVVLMRTDIRSGTKEFHEAALLANTTAKKNINLDFDLIQEIAIEEFDIDIIELGVEIDIDAMEMPNELTAPLKNEPPTIKLTFSSFKQLGRFEDEIKKLIETDEFSNVTYSISQGEI